MSMNSSFANLSAASVSSMSVSDKNAMFEELNQTAVLWISNPASRKKNEFGYISVVASDGISATAPHCGGRKGAVRFNNVRMCSLDMNIGNDEIDPDTRDSRKAFARFWLGHTGVADAIEDIDAEDLNGIKVIVNGRICKNEQVRRDGTVSVYYNFKVNWIKPIYDEEAELTPFTLDLTKAAPKDVFDDLKDAWKQVKQYGQYAHESTSEQSQLPL